MGDIITRTLSTGRVAFYARYVEIDGNRTAKKINAKSIEDARVRLASIEDRVAAGQPGIVRPKRKAEPEAPKVSALTVDDLFKKFVVEFQSPKIKDSKDYIKQKKSLFKVHVLPHLGAAVASSVRHLDVERMRDVLLAGGVSNRMAQKALSDLSKVYSWAIRKELVSCPNPCKGVERPVCESTVDFLSADEAKGLLVFLAKQHDELRAGKVLLTTSKAKDEKTGVEKVQHALYPAVAFALYVGARKGELCGLRWRDLHLDQARVDIMRSYHSTPKSGKPRYVPLNAELVTILRLWKAHCPTTDEGLVFPYDGGAGPRMPDRFRLWGLPDAMKGAEVHETDRPWHVLRHTFASHFMMAGGNVLTLQKLLGHSDVKTTMIYAHLSPDHLAGEVAQMSFAQKSATVADMDEERRKRA